MSYFDRDKKSFGGRRNDGFGDRGPRRGGGGWDSERPAMHKATCADCGKTCEVPFKPNGEKPVYCSECFEAQKFNRAPREERSYDDRRPSERKTPERSFPSGSSGNNEQTHKKLEALEMKLDTIINLLSLSLHTGKTEKSAKKETKSEEPEDTTPLSFIQAKKKEKAATKAKKEIKSTVKKSKAKKK